MRQPLLLTRLALTLASLSASAGLAFAAPESAQSKACYAKASAQNLHGAARTSFHRTCMKGALSPDKPTAATPSAKEARAITAPSGSDRTVRSKQCSEEADRRGLTDKDREAFRLSCMATAGPVTEAQMHSQAPHPAKAIPGIGVNGENHPQ